MIFLLAFQANGQQVLAVQSGARLSLGSGTNLRVSGDMTNNGTIEGTGMLTIISSGSFTNTGVLKIDMASLADHLTVSVAGSFNAGGTFEVNASFSPNAVDQATVLTSATAVNGTFSNSDNNDWTANYDLPNLGEFTISYLSALAVELIDFQAILQEDQKVLLNWKTASETNNKGFEIERSTDGSNWKMLSFVPGHDNSLETHSYFFIDERPVSGTNYYRLRQMDYDGQYEYSKTITMEVSKTGSGISLFPNPATGSVTFALESGYTGKATLTLYNLLGQQMKTLLLLSESRAFRTEIDLSGLPSGVYLAKVQAGRERWQEQLVVK